VRLSKLETILEDDGVIFLSHGGLLTQSIIVGMTEALEQESESSEISMAISHNILTIFIELSQNMMTHGKKMHLQNAGFNQKAMIIVGYNKDDSEYYVLSRNIITEEEAVQLRSKIDALLPLNKEELKSLYRERRKSGKDKHVSGAGIGFIEIARRCDQMDYDLTKADNGKLYFAFKAIIKRPKI
jgi:uncharacterized protein DUF6272